MKLLVIFYWLTFQNFKVNLLKENVLDFLMKINNYDHVLVEYEIGWTSKSSFSLQVDIKLKSIFDFSLVLEPIFTLLLASFLLTNNDIPKPTVL